MVPAYKHLFDATKWGIGISGFTWWFAASTPPMPPRHQWVALCFLPWLMWAPPYYKLIRSTIWPSLIALTILFRGELTGVMLLTQLFLSLAYYFFILEEQQLPETESTPLPPEGLSRNEAPSIFLLFGAAFVSLSLIFVPGTPTLFILFFTSLIAAQLAWWKRSCSFRLARKEQYSGIAASTVLFLVAFAGYLLQVTPLFIAGITGVVIFTLLTPRVLRDRNTRDKKTTG